MKQLTVANWNEADSASTVFSVADRGVPRKVTGDDVARVLLNRRLARNVPPEVRELFNAAVGIGVYGWFYYPLFAISADQLRRVADRAAQLRVEELGGPFGRPFAERLKWLERQGALSEDQHYGWTQTRLRRNEGSHPAKFQRLEMPIQLMSVIVLIADRIEALWEGRA
jgi:hypothetical protein